jgi:hypothetical protein
MRRPRPRTSCPGQAGGRPHARVPNSGSLVRPRDSAPDVLYEPERHGQGNDLVCPGHGLDMHGATPVPEGRRALWLRIWWGPGRRFSLSQTFARARAMNTLAISQAPFLCPLTSGATVRRGSLQTGSGHLTPCRSPPTATCPKHGKS